MLELMETKASVALTCCHIYWETLYTEPNYSLPPPNLCKKWYDENNYFSFYQNRKGL